MNETVKHETTPCDILVMVVTPLYNRVFDSTLKQLMKQKVPKGVQYDLFMPYVGHGDGDVISNVSITNKYNTAREHILNVRHKYQRVYMWCVESDMDIPLNALEQLLEASEFYQVVYGLYAFRREPISLNHYAAMRYSSDELEDGDDDLEMWGMPVDTITPDQCRKFMREQLIVPTDGVGLGCTLISGEALDASEFYIDWEKPHGKGTKDEHFSHCDWYTTEAWYEAGIKSAMHYGVRCGHHTVINGNGCTLYPAQYGIVPSNLWRSIPYGGFDTDLETIDKFGWVYDPKIVARYQECLCTPTDMTQNMAFLASVARGVVVELGTRYGVSTTAFMVKASVTNVIAIDNETTFAAQFFEHDERFTMVKGDSTDPAIVERVMAEHPGGIDILLIDTLHTTEQVLAELELWYPHVRVGGHIVLHDTQIKEVRDAIDIWYDQQLFRTCSAQYYTTGEPNMNPYPCGLITKIG